MPKTSQTKDRKMRFFVIEKFAFLGWGWPLEKNSVEFISYRNGIEFTYSWSKDVRAIFGHELMDSDCACAQYR